MKKILIKIIEIYQKTLSPDTGWFQYTSTGQHCKYIPTCSEYTKQSIEKYGALKGSIKGFKRIVRCSPFSKGGYDPA